MEIRPDYDITRQVHAIGMSSSLATDPITDNRSVFSGVMNQNEQQISINYNSEREAILSKAKDTVSRSIYKRIEQLSLNELKQVNRLLEFKAYNRSGKLINLFSEGRTLEYVLDDLSTVDSVLECAQMTYVDENGMTKACFDDYDIAKFLEEKIDTKSPNFKKLASIMRNDANFYSTGCHYGDECDKYEVFSKEFSDLAYKVRHKAPRFTSYAIVDLINNNVDADSERFKEFLDTTYKNSEGELRPLFDFIEIGRYFHSDADVGRIAKLIQIPWYYNGKESRMIDYYEEVIKFAKCKDFDTLVELANLTATKDGVKNSLFYGRYFTEMLENDLDFKVVLGLSKQTIKDANGEETLKFKDGFYVLKEALQLKKKEKELNKVLEFVKNEDFKKMVLEFYNKDKITNLDEAMSIVDAYNNMSGEYTTIVYNQGESSPLYDYSKYCKKQGFNLKTNLTTQERYPDLIEESRVGRLIELCKEKRSSSIIEYLYKDVYLKNKVLPAEIKELCLQINKQYGTKLFLPMNFDYSSENIVQYIKDEFDMWAEASKNTAKFPTVLDLLSAKRDYIDVTSAYGEGTSSGYYTWRSKSISVDGYKDVISTLRHELMHCNDLKREKGISFEKHWFNRDGKTVLQSIKETLGKEFSRLGLTYPHIDYAFNNPREFIAVAAEGDISKCSTDFFELLKKFGMPEWFKYMKKIRI